MLKPKCFGCCHVGFSTPAVTMFSWPGAVLMYRAMLASLASCMHHKLHGSNVPAQMPANQRRATDYHNNIIRVQHKPLGWLPHASNIILQIIIKSRDWRKPYASTLFKEATPTTLSLSTYKRNIPTTVYLLYERKFIFKTESSFEPAVHHFSSV